MRCFELGVRNGVVMRAIRDVLAFSPPLIISKSEIDELVDLALRSIDQASGELLG